jgi:hypothetical protein
MDLFDKIDQFEKMANELDSDEMIDLNDIAETIEDYTVSHLERQASTRKRMRKLIALLK